MFIAALSTIAKLWKEPKYPLTDEWIKKLWFIYRMEYYLAMRNNKTWPFLARWMDMESVICDMKYVMQRKTDTICFHSYVDPEKLNRRPWGWGRGKKKLEREGGKP